MERLRVSVCWLLGAALVLNSVATTTGLRQLKAWERSKRGADFVDDVSRFEANLGGLRARLASRASVRYVTSVPNQEIWQLTTAEHYLRFYIAQYALAPTVLRWGNPNASHVPESSGRTFLLANFPTPASLDAYLRTQGHEIRWRREAVALLRER
jgi:hypothetical protein